MLMHANSFVFLSAFIYYDELLLKRQKTFQVIETQRSSVMGIFDHIMC
jgi:hypothetical protein